MKKLTAKKCRQRIWELKVLLDKDQLSITGEIALQALEIALPILERQEKKYSSNPALATMNEWAKAVVEQQESQKEVSNDL